MLSNNGAAAASTCAPGASHQIPSSAQRNPGGVSASAAAYRPSRVVSVLTLARIAASRNGAASSGSSRSYPVSSVQNAVEVIDATWMPAAGVRPTLTDISTAAGVSASSS